jgi:hypothetical protein
MSKVITFSRFFPAYHPKKGEPTYFIEKVLNSVDKQNHWFGYCDCCGWAGSANAMRGGEQIADTGDYNDCLCPKCWSSDIKELDIIDDYYLGKYEPKHHTIRAGNRWKVGDKFSPRVWSGKPYQSKQIIIAPDIEIKKIWPFEMDEIGLYYINGSTRAFNIETVANNDGLTYPDFDAWFRIHPKAKKQTFTGQIICWNDSINY